MSGFTRPVVVRPMSKQYTGIGELQGSDLTRSHRTKLVVFLRDGFVCQYCGEHSFNRRYTTTFLVPKSEGGTRSPKNLVVACEKCCKAKGGKRSPHEEEDLKRLADSTDEFRTRYPTINSVLQRYVELIEEGHRLARIHYLRTLNEIKKGRMQ